MKVSSYFSASEILSLLKQDVSLQGSQEGRSLGKQSQDPLCFFVLFVLAFLSETPWETGNRQSQGQNVMKTNYRFPVNMLHL